MALVLAATGLLAFSGSAQGATDTWNGAAGGSGVGFNWGNDGAGGNWTGSTPANGDTLTFAGSIGLTNTNELLTSAGEITFSSGAGAFDLTGNALALTGGTVGPAGTIEQDNAIGVVETIGMATTWNSGDSIIEAAAGATVDFAGGVTRNTTSVGAGLNFAGGAFITTANSPGTFEFGGASVFSGPSVALDVTGEGFTERNNTTITLLSNATLTVNGMFWAVGQNATTTSGTATLNLQANSRLSISSTTPFSVGLDYGTNANTQTGVVNLSGTFIAAIPSQGFNTDAQGFIRLGDDGGATAADPDTGTLNLDSGGVLETSREITSGGSFSTLSSATVPTNQNGYVVFNGGTLETDGVNSVANWLNATTTGKLQALTSVTIDGGAGGGAYFDTNGVDAVIAYGMADGAVAGGFLTKEGAGTLSLTGANTYTGATIVNAGTLAVSGSLAGTDALTINGSTAAVDLNSPDDISASAHVTLAGGTLATLASQTETLDDLTLGAGSSTLTLGATGSIIHFANSSANIWTGTLAINDWNGASLGGGSDQIFIGSTKNLTAGQLADIKFIAPTINGVAQVGTFGAVQLADGEITVAIPEPATCASFFAGLGMLLVWQRSSSRRRA